MAKTTLTTSETTKAGTVKAVKAKTKPAATVAVASTPKTRKVYRVTYPPKSGNGLFTYFLAAMASLGGFTMDRKPMRKDSLCAFLDSGTAASYHEKKGNFEKMPGQAGYIRLTTAGWNYFSGRISGATAGQTVHQADIDALVKAFAAGRLEEKVTHFGTDTKFRAIEIFE